MEDFAQFLQRYDFLLRKVLVHMRIYANFDEFYHLATIALWQSACTYHVERGEQQLLQYIFVYGYTNEEVGRLFGVGEEAIKKRRQRLLRKLKQGLMEDSNMIL